MRRFILRTNVDRFKALLADSATDIERGQLNRLLMQAEQELRGSTEIWKLTCPHLHLNPSLGHLLENQLDKFVLNQNAGYGSLQLWDSRTETLYLVAQSNFREQFAQVFAVVRAGDGTVCEKAAAGGETIFVKDIQASDAFEGVRPFASQNGIHAVQSTPIQTKTGALLGVFSTYFCEPNPFSANMQSDCRTMAEQARALIVSARHT